MEKHENCAGCWNSFAWNLCCISNFDWLLADTVVGEDASREARQSEKVYLVDRITSSAWCDVWAVPGRVTTVWNSDGHNSPAKTWQPLGDGVMMYRSISMMSIHVIHVIHVTNIYQHHPIPIIYISWLLHNTHTHVWKNMMNMSYLIHWLTDCFIIRTYSYYPRIGSREKTYWKPHFQWVRPGFPVDFVLNQSIECWLHSHIAGYIPIISIISNDIPIISPCYIPIIIYHNPIISSDININAPMGL